MVMIIAFYSLMYYEIRPKPYARRIHDSSSNSFGTMEAFEIKEMRESDAVVCRLVPSVIAPLRKYKYKILQKRARLVYSVVDAAA